jgi:hypothetical protein
MDLQRRIRGGVLHITPWFFRLWYRKPQGSKRGLAKRTPRKTFTGCANPCKLTYFPGLCHAQCLPQVARTGALLAMERK